MPRWLGRLLVGDPEVVRENNRGMELFYRVLFITYFNGRCSCLFHAYFGREGIGEERARETASTFYIKLYDGLLETCWMYTECSQLWCK